jgi:threonine synthase
VFIQRCINCPSEFGLEERLYVCSNCGDLLEIERVDADDLDVESWRALWSERRKSGDARDRSGVWRFREFLPFAENVPVVSLGEGNTPLYDAPRSADYCGLAALKLKHQGNNPTGSFKDTGMTVAVTQALHLGMRVVACASTGNTAASLAAYAARARMACAILVPEGQVSDAKLAQALDYGAKVLEIEGNFDVCMRVIRELAEQSSLYLVNSINPFRIEGQKTVAFELAEQLEWDVPDHLVVPGGNLGNSSAFGKGFRELFGLKLISKRPRISVIQAEGAAPFARHFAQRGPTFVDEKHPQTLATAIKIGAPVSWKKSLHTVVKTRGQVLTVSEQEIADAKATIGRDGIGCEPASATTVAGIRKLVGEGAIKKDETVVAVLTGHLLKDTDYVIKYHSHTLTSPSGESIRGTYANSIQRVAARPCAIETALKDLS